MSEQATEDQVKWWKKFCAVLDEMPTSMEILVDATGGINVASRHASRDYFKKHGDVDNVPTILLPSWRGEGVENNGSSL